MTKEELDWRQYCEWGVRVRTTNVRPVHVANGLVQLLRLAKSPVAQPALESAFLDLYLARVKGALQAQGLDGLDRRMQALLVMRSKRHGPLSLAIPVQDEPSFLKKGRDHFSKMLELEGPGTLTPEQQKLLSLVFNADGKVMESGGEDPTTPGLGLAGLTDTHTLRGMHAATFLGLLCHTESGREAIARLYELLASDHDGHARLLKLIGLAASGPEGTWMSSLSPDLFKGRYPMPPRTNEWDDVASRTGRMTRNLLRWCALGTSKADTLMAVVDLAALVLTLRLLRWSSNNGAGAADRRLLLMLSPTQVTGDIRTAVARAQQSLRAAAAALDDAAKQAHLLERLDAETRDEGNGGSGTEDGSAAATETGGGRYRYLPGAHALNLGAAGGWLYPMEPHGGARRYVRPGARQLTTLVHALVPPPAAGFDTGLTWAEFAREGEALGLAVGGPDEHRIEGRLGIGPVSETLRRVGAANQEHLISLGLARRESDNVVIVDGGAQ